MKRNIDEAMKWMETVETDKAWKEKRRRSDSSSQRKLSVYGR